MEWIKCEVQTVWDSKLYPALITKNPNHERRVLVMYLDGSVLSTWDEYLVRVVYLPEYESLWG